MTTHQRDRLPMVLAEEERALLDDWLHEQQTSMSRQNRISSSELRQQSAEFLRLLRQTLSEADADPPSAAWQPVREFLASISRSRALQGFSPSETATFVFSLKQPLFAALQRAAGSDRANVADDLGLISTLLDQLGLYTTEVYQQSREVIIGRQQQELLELSTPVVTLWDGVLALPLIGTLDSARTQVVMESLLQRILETGSTIAIIDITGVPTVDTLVAQHLLKTIAAARLMGADCIISGIRPQIAQTIIHLGVNLGDVVTKASLADALRSALERAGYVVTRSQRP